jgi:glutamate/tyrosine decarboxylase-like PLP-dependent enzyme
MGAPLQTSVFLSKHPGLLASANSANAQYLFQKDKNFNEFDVGDKLVSCGRHADQLKLWMMWKALGDEGFEARVDHNVALIAHMTERVNTVRDSEGRPCFLLVADSKFANLCFYMVPPSMRDELAGVASAADLTDDQRTALSTVAPVVKDRMQRSGSGLIGFQPVNGFSNCWRMVIAGAKEALTNDGIDAILDDMLALGDDL